MTTTVHHARKLALIAVLGAVSATGLAAQTIPNRVPEEQGEVLTTVYSTLPALAEMTTPERDAFRAEVRAYLQNAYGRALAQGVRAAHIVDGRVPHSLLLEVFTNAGIGAAIVTGVVSWIAGAFIGGEEGRG